MRKRFGALLARLAFFVNQWTLELQAYPNPFNSQTTLKIKLAQNWKIDDLSFTFYNLMGQVVRAFHPPMTTEREIILTWDGRNDFDQMVASGSYLFVMTTPKHRHTLKLLLLK